MKPEITGLFRDKKNVGYRISKATPLVPYNHAVLLEIEQEIQKLINNSNGAGHEVFESRGNPYTKIIIFEIPQDIARE